MALDLLWDVVSLVETREGRLTWNRVPVLRALGCSCLIGLGLCLGGIHGDLSLCLSQLTLRDTNLPLQH
ncbi:hypothetical protein MUK42_23661 [Musa troglodytarum]|uniref:Uncharacterized protein n=1 Tax=Musa troglodytarum TaxID=320322 RepID=A0A9E7EHH5_9LILI|nr:hypothetical protein MUK42_23661 [Musa troglodytarum]